MKKMLTGIMLTASILCLAGALNVATAADFNWQQFKGTTLRVLFNKSAVSEGIKPYIPEFEKLTGMKVNLEEYPEDMYRQKITIEMTAKSKSMDVFMSMLIQEGLKFQKAGWYEPIQKFLDDSSITAPEFDVNDILQGSMDMETVNGVLVGLPVLLEGELMYYRSDLLKKYGIDVPAGFVAFSEAARKMTFDKDGDGKNDFYGLTYRGKRAATVGMLAVFLHNFGGEWLDENRNPAWGSEAGLTAIDLYGRLLRLYGPPGSVNNHWYECTSIFAQGQAAMLLEFAGQYAWLIDPKRSKVYDKVKCAVHPAGPMGTHPNIVGWGLSMNHLSQHKRAAWLFIQWATNKENCLRFQKSGHPSVRLSAWEWAKNQGKHVDFVETMIETLSKGTGAALPPVLPVSEVRDMIGDAVVTSIEGGDVVAAVEKSVEQALELKATGNW